MDYVVIFFSGCIVGFLCSSILCEINHDIPMKRIGAFCWYCRARIASFAFWKMMQGAEYLKPLRLLLNCPHFTVSCRCIYGGLLDVAILVILHLCFLHSLSLFSGESEEVIAHHQPSNIWATIGVARHIGNYRFKVCVLSPIICHAAVVSSSSELRVFTSDCRRWVFFFARGEELGQAVLPVLEVEVFDFHLFFSL